MGCLITFQEFRRVFSHSFGLYEGKPVLYLLPDSLFYLAPNVWSREIDRQVHRLYRIAVENLAENDQFQADMFTPTAHDDPRATFSLPLYGYVACADGRVRFYEPARAAGSAIGHSHLQPILFGDPGRDVEESSYSLVTHAAFRKPLAQAILGRYPARAPGRPTILSAVYACFPVGFGEVENVVYRGNKIVGLYEPAKKLLRVFPGPGAEIHRVRLKELINV